MRTEILVIIRNGIRIVGSNTDAVVHFIDYDSDTMICDDKAESINHQVVIDEIHKAKVEQRRRKLADLRPIHPDLKMFVENDPDLCFEMAIRAGHFPDSDPVRNYMYMYTSFPDAATDLLHFKNRNTRKYKNFTITKK